MKDVDRSNLVCNNTLMNETAILELLKKHISGSITTTKAQYSDSLDFHDVHIVGLVNLVNAAFKAGYGEGFEDAQPAWS